jgi:hypothetical protein
MRGQTRRAVENHLALTLPAHGLTPADCAARSGLPAEDFQAFVDDPTRVPDPELMQWLYVAGASDVATGVRRLSTRRKLGTKQRAPVDTCANYLDKYAEFLRYDAYLADGLPIATGVIEGACRYLVKDRMEKTAARWSTSGAEAVLRLRSLMASKDFDEYWAFHEAKEVERNHVQHYAGGELPAIKPAKRVVGRTD